MERSTLTSQGFPSEVALPNHSFNKELLSPPARHSARHHNEITTQINATKNVAKGKNMLEKVCSAEKHLF